jgi:hypothetical protein
MQRLRNASLLARLVLAWFALSIGAAVASPVVQPRALELLCTGTGAVKLMVQGDDGQPAPAGHALDCPLCAALSAPPPAARNAVPTEPQAQAAPGQRSVRASPLLAPPPPARGPPAAAVT